jgi:tetrapyrrole methylase family protein/MazG family protein
VTPARVVVVGLGPAGVDLMLPVARSAFERIPGRFVRTARHPAVAELGARGVVARSFDAVYEGAASYDAVYDEIADTVVAAARVEGEVVYAVPGNPAVAERSVHRIRDRAGPDVAVEIVPGLSFVDLAWTRLGRDPMAGAHVVDAHDFLPSAAGRSGPLLLGHCTDRMVLSDVKLALLETLPPDTVVTVLARLGLPDESVTDVALAELDRAVEPDHLTSLFVDAGARTVAGDVADLVALARRLRGPGGCPWDAAQSHHSLTRYLLEEAYEVVEALERLPADAPAGAVDLDAYAHVEDELGDLMFQVVFHAILAAEAGAFDLGDVARAVHDKLVRRHPHVFGDVDADTPDAVVANWEQIKKSERSSSSLVEGITPGLPALLYAHKLYRKAASVGLDPDEERDGYAAMVGALDALRTATDAVAAERALGELLAAAVVVAREQGVDAESSLAGWSARFRERFVRMEAAAASAGVELSATDPATVRALWAAVARETP